MDELERMFRQLLQGARAVSPEYLARPFEVAEIYHTLLPYRLNRRELAMDSVQQYERTLMRMLAGERGYLTGDAELQRAMQDELQQPNPDTSAFRAFASAPVAFSPDAVRALERDPDAQATPDSSGPTPPDPGRPLPTTLPYIAAIPPAPAPAATPAPAPVAAANPAPLAASEPTPAAAAELPSSIPAPRVPTPLLAPMNVGVRIKDAPAAVPTGTRAAATPAECPYCGGRLPEGRDVAFCPHCGQNITVRHCPACSTEIEVGWRFCVTCGRNVEETSAPGA